MKKLLYLLLLLPALVGAQVRYKAAKRADGTQVVRKESVPGSGVFDVVVSALPSDAARARIAGRVLVPYAREAAKTLNLSQFGTNKYYSSNYRFSIDFNPFESVATRKSYGVSLHSAWATTESEWNSLAVGEGLNYVTESSLHGPYEGQGYYESSLATIEAYYQSSVVGAQKGFWVPNIETSNEWWPGDQNSPLAGFNGQASYSTPKYPEAWSSAKNKTIQLESTGETVTLETLAGRGFSAWNAEMVTRRTNRIVVMMLIAKQRSPAGTKIAFGSSMYQGAPKLNDAYGTGAFQDGFADVSHIGGDANGNIILNGRSYQIKGDIWSQETFHLDYYYQFSFHISQADYEDIWVNQNPAKMNYPSIWAAIKPRHVVADQKGHWQCNRYRMKNRSGQSVRGSICMRELVYEADKAGFVDGIAYPNDLIGRVPSGLNTGCIDFLDGGSTCDDQPKIWIPPYEMYTYYAVHRFLEGGLPGSGFHLFNAPARLNFNSQAGYNHQYHSVSALFQARADLQPYEVLLDNSTLVEDPEVQINQTGDFSSYDGIQAYNNDGEGTIGTQKPAYILRYQQIAGGWRVLVLGGMNQGWTDERTDIVRVPGGLLNGNQFKIKLRGPAAQVFEFIVSSSDSNQVYEALPSAQTSWEKPGYAGRVN